MKKFIITLSIITLCFLVVGVISFFMLDNEVYVDLMHSTPGFMPNIELYPIYDKVMDFSMTAYDTFENIRSNIDFFLRNLF